MLPSRLLMFAAAGALLLAGGCASRRPAPAAAAPGAFNPSDASAVASPPSAAGSGAGPGIAQPGSAYAAALAREFADSVGDRVYFALDSHALSPEAGAVLDAQAAWLRGRPELRVLIAGHADERGTREYNLALGSRRAQAVREHLVARGVGPARIDVVSYGKERPVDPRSNEEGWALNRNAHTVLIDLVGAS